MASPSPFLLLSSFTHTSHLPRFYLRRYQYFSTLFWVCVAFLLSLWPVVAASQLPVFAGEFRMPSIPPHSLTRAVGNLLASSEEREKAKELTRQYCGDAIDQAYPLSQFSSFIDRGNQFSRDLVRGLSFLGGSQMKNYVFESSDGNYQIVNLASIIFFAILAVTIALIVGSIMAVFVVRSSCWTKCLSSCSCCQRRPTKRVSRWTQKFWFRMFAVGCLILVVLVLFAVANTIKLGTRLPDVQCQLARFGAEVNEGILYDQSSEESKWMQGLKSDARFGGFGPAYDMLTNVKEQFGDVNAPMMRELTERLTTLPVSAKLITNKAKDQSNSLGALPQDEPFLKRLAQEALSPQGGLNNALLTMYESAEDSVNQLQQNVLKQYNDVNLIAVTDEAIQGFSGLQSDFSQFSIDLLESVNSKNKGFTGLIFVPYLIVALILLIGVFVVTLLLIRWWRRYKRFQSSQESTIAQDRTRAADGQEGNPEDEIVAHRKSSSRFFASLWAWFGITGAIALFFGFVGFILLSTTDSMCTVVQHSAEDPSTLREYAKLEGYYPADPDNSIRRAVDICYADQGDGSLMNVVVQDRLEKMVESIRSVNDQFKIDKQEQPPKHQAYEPVLRNLKLVKGVQEVDYVAIYKGASRGGMFDWSHFLIPPEILLSGDQKERITLEPDSENRVFGLEGLRKGNIDTAMTKSSDMFFWFDHPDVQSCVKKHFGHELTIYGMIDHLNSLRLALDQIIAASQPCANLVDWKLCITLEDGNISCSSGGAHVVDISGLQYSGSDTPKFGEDFKYTLPNQEDDDNLRSCRQSITWDRQTPTCPSFYVHTLVFGIWLAWKKSQSYSPKEAHELVDQIGSLLGEFDQIFAPVEEQMNVIDQGLAAAVDQDLDCKSLGYSFGSIVDGLCGGLQRDLFWSSLFFCVLALASFAFWLVCYLIYLHFLRPLSKEEEDQEDDSESISPKTLDRTATTVSTEVPPPPIDSSGSLLLERVIAHDVDGVDRHSRVVDPNLAVDENGNTGLHYAAHDGEAEIIGILLKRNARQTTNVFGYTPLAVAASEGHAECVGLLMKHGADPTVLDEFGDTALHAAARSNDRPVVEALCENSAAVPVYLNDEGIGPADAAAVHGYIEIENLIKSKAAITEGDQTTRSDHDSS